MAGILNIQISSTFDDREINLKKVEHFMKKHSDKKPDLVVFPEFFSTGVDYDIFVKNAQDENGGETIEKICALAKKYNTNIIAGTVIEKSGADYYNTSFAINRAGEIVSKYRKIHLFDFLGGTEDEIITPGNEIVTVDFDFAKVGLAICADIRYPGHFNKLAKQNVDIIVAPCAWLVPKEIYEDKSALEYARDMWIAINRTRAYDNGVYLVECNQTKAVNDNYCGIGTSMIISPTAEILANAKDDQCAVFAQIEVDAVKYLRSVYPVGQFD